MHNHWVQGISFNKDLLIVSYGTCAGFTQPRKVHLLPCHARTHLPDAERAVLAGGDEALVVEGEPHLGDRVAVQLVLRPVSGQRQREAEGLEEGE